MKSIHLKAHTTYISRKSSSSVRVSRTKRSIANKVPSISQKRLIENKNSFERKSPIIHVTIRSKKSTDHHRRHSIQPFTTKNLSDGSIFSKANDKHMKAKKSIKKRRKFTNKSLVKSFSPQVETSILSKEIFARTSLSSQVQSSKLSSLELKQTNKYSEEYGQSLEFHKEKKQRKRAYEFGYDCCPCSLLRIFFISIGIILLGTALSAVIMGILMSQKATTTVSMSTTRTTTVTSTTVTTTTTTTYVCNSTCLNQTWQSSTNLISEWSFDQTFNDELGNYNATSVNNVSFTTQGYVRQAAVFTVNTSQMLVVPYMPISSSSFTVETWLYITLLMPVTDQCIFGLCSTATNFLCLHIAIRLISGNYYLYIGFFNADCPGTTRLTLNTWIHAAFVFDIVNMKQSIYLNGILDASCSVPSALLVSPPNNVTIGNIPSLTPLTESKYFQGYMDQMIVSTRPKSSCEILEDATLAAHFTFDIGLVVVDSGPNSLSATIQATSTMLSGHFAQALSFSGSSSSYFQINDLTSLGISNQSFSISLWIQPVSLSGVLVHVSSNASGLGWCLPFIGFATNGSIVAQILNNNGIISASGSFPTISTSTWSHIVQTWSSTNGLRLYINNILVASSVTLATTYTASAVSNYLTLGNSLNGGTCGQGQIGSLTPYQGAIDDVRVYSRELSTADICTLYVA